MAGMTVEAILTRRRLLGSMAMLSARAMLGQAARVLPEGNAVVALRPGAGKALALIPADFMGLGYEMSSAARLGLLSPDNAVYVELLRNLGPHGVLRLGGIVADFTSYSANGVVKTEPKNTVVTLASLQQLRGFLDRTGWTAIWSVNFGAGTIASAIEEARDVVRVLGPRLLAIELGNEVENYSRGKMPLRPPPYRYEDYRAEYLRWRTEIFAAVPGVRFAAPDTATSVEWVERMAVDAHGDVQLLTTHYYRGDQKLATQAQLLQADPELLSRLERLRVASQKSGIPWRMCETNSFFGGGHPGLSDTLAGALWTLDYMLLLAKYGCAGVNIETGVNQLGFISPYSPIKDDEAGHNSAGAPYYGMLAFAVACANASSVLPLVMEPDQGSNLTCYALGEGKQVRSVVLINKESESAVAVSLQRLHPGHASGLRLTGPSLDSTTGVTLGGTTVDATGHWASARWESIPSGIVLVPPGSAIIVRFER
jgi:hypothetical protein